MQGSLIAKRHASELFLSPAFKELPLFSVIKSRCFFETFWCALVDGANRTQDQGTIIPILRAAYRDACFIAEACNLTNGARQLNQAVDVLSCSCPPSSTAFIMLIMHSRT